MLSHIWSLGEKLRTGINALAQKHGLHEHVQCLGLAPRTLMAFKDRHRQISIPLATLFQQELRLAASGSLAVVDSDVIEFTANINNLVTNATAPVAAGQTTVAVEDGRGWPDGKAVRICWNDQCVDFTLARSGQRNLLTFVEPAPRSIPSGASAVVMNRVRYYSRPDERGMLRWLRQIDGGASVIAGNIAAFTVRYWDAQGRPVTHPDSVRRVQAEISLPGRTVAESREITLRT